MSNNDAHNGAHVEGMAAPEPYPNAPVVDLWPALLAAMERAPGPRSMDIREVAQWKAVQHRITAVVRARAEAAGPIVPSSPTDAVIDALLAVFVATQHARMRDKEALAKASVLVGSALHVLVQAGLGEET
jgi:hypothetical protein